MDFESSHVFGRSDLLECTSWNYTVRIMSDISDRIVRSIAFFWPEGVTDHTCACRASKINGGHFSRRRDQTEQRFWHRQRDFAVEQDLAALLTVNFVVSGHFKTWRRSERIQKTDVFRFRSERRQPECNAIIRSISACVRWTAVGLPNQVSLPLAW